MLEYKWKLPGFAKGIDPAIAVQEIDRIQSIYGKVTPNWIVAESTDPSSVLHSAFEWDDTKAANAHRVQQARILINNIEVIIIDDDKPRQIAVYEVTSLTEGYKSFNTFTLTDIAYIKADILCQLSFLNKKLKLYKEFDKVLCHVNAAIAELS